MLLTLNDLINFYSKKKKSMHFNSEQSGEPIVVQVDGIMKFEKSDDTEGLTAVRLQSCHTDRNLNASSISYEVMNDKMLPSFKNRPILGYIHDVDGKPQFYGHNMHIDEKTDEMIYDEIAVGIIPETNNAKLEYDKENDRYNVIVDGYIFNEYTKAAEILEREQECSVSVEIAIRSMSYSAKEKCLVIEDGYFSGVTILGYDDNGNIVKPGMAGSNIKLKDFSESNNSMFSDMNEDEHSKLIETLERLNDTLSKFNINDNQGKEENEVAKLENFEEVVEEVTETTEEVVEEVTNEVTEEFTEEVTVTEEMSEETTEETPEVVVEESVEEVAETTETPEVTEEFVEDDTDDEDDDEDDEDDKENFSEVVENTEIKPEKYSITMSDGSIKEFALSLEDINNALWTLVNTTYGESDNTYYSVIVYEDNTLVMVDWWNAKAFRQKYSREDDNFGLVGDRIPVTQIWVSEEEENAINEMKDNYSSISTELASYKEAELCAKREEVFNDPAYAEFVETDGFKNIKANIDTYSVDDLRTACDLQFAKEVKAKGTFTFTCEKKEINKPSFFAFAQQTKDTSFLDGLLKK